MGIFLTISNTRPFPKLIPPKSNLQSPFIHIALSGILPFGSIFMEMFFIFSALWQYRYYYVFGFLLLVNIILVLVTLCVTVVSTYFLLNTEDYRWQWTSFMGGASVGVYVFIYAVHYFMVRTSMYGLLQVSYYFGYVLLACFGLGLMGGIHQQYKLTFRRNRFCWCIYIRLHNIQQTFKVGLNKSESPDTIHKAQNHQNHQNNKTQPNQTTLKL